MKLAAALLLAIAVTAGAADPRLGKKIYVRGEGTSAIDAVTDAEGTLVVPASVLRCVNCHGYDGRGNAEGGVKPSNLQWPELTKIYTTAARAHPPYTPSTLKRAITMGIDPAGNELDRVMPRYRMSARDADDLVAYLRTLGTVTDPGLTDDAIRIGVLLSPDRTRAAAVRDVVTGFFEEVNRAGGVYGRRIDVRYAELPANASARRDALQAFLDEQEPFALTASSLLGAEASLAACIESREIPAVAAFSGDAAEERYLFRLLGSAVQEVAALRAFAQNDGVVEVRETTSLDAMRGAKNVLLHADRLKDVLRAAAELPSPPRILVPSTFANDALFAAPTALDGRIIVALPSAPSHLTSGGIRELEGLSPRAAAHPQTAAAALTAAKVMAEGLRRAGRDVSREKLVETLEGFYNVPTALTPPISFGPASRTGTRGAWLATVDLRTKTLVDGRWQEPR